MRLEAESASVVRHDYPDILYMREESREILLRSKDL